MNAPRPPADKRRGKDRALDEIPDAPQDDRDPPDDHPGQESADLKEDPKSSTARKKTRTSRRVRISQDLEALEQGQGATPALDDEAPMNARSPAKPSSTPKALPTRVTKPKVQNRANLKATCLGRHKVEQGVVRWYWRIDRCPTPQNGLKTRETAKCLYATVEEVQAELEELVKRGEHRGALAKGDSQHKISDLMMMEIEASKSEWARTTIRGIQNYHRIIADRLGDARVDNNAGRRIDAMFTSLREEGYARLTVQAIMTYLVRAWRNQVKRGRISLPLPDLTFRWPKARGEGAVRYTPPRAHINQVINHLKGEPQLVVRVMAVTGARVGEIGGVRRCDYDPVTKLLLVNGKTGPRMIPVDVSIQEALAARADGSTNPMFNCVPPPETKRWVNHKLTRACRRLGLKHFSSHALRRAAIDHLYETKVEPSTVAKLMGHGVSVALKHYRTPTDESMRRAIEGAAMGDFSGAAVARRSALAHLSELLKDEEIQRDSKAWDAIQNAINCIGRVGADAQESQRPPVTSRPQPDSITDLSHTARLGQEEQALHSSTPHKAPAHAAALDAASQPRRKPGRPKKQPVAPAPPAAQPSNPKRPVIPVAPKATPLPPASAAPALPKSRGRPALSGRAPAKAGDSRSPLPGSSS
jgi:integrase